MGLAGPTGATSKQEGSLAWAVGITLNGYPLHTPSHARVPAEPQSGPTNSFGRCKCWVLILADRGWPGVRGVKGIPILGNSQDPSVSRGLRNVDKNDAEAGNCRNLRNAGAH